MVKVLHERLCRILLCIINLEGGSTRQVFFINKRNIWQDWIKYFKPLIWVQLFVHTCTHTHSTHAHLTSTHAHLTHTTYVQTNYNYTRYEDRILLKITNHHDSVDNGRVPVPLWFHAWCNIVSFRKAFVCEKLNEWLRHSASLQLKFNFRK
jgi:hypothetical protein